MDLLVTTPKNRIKEAAEEAEAAKRDGGYYFRRFATRPKDYRVGDRVFYVMDGFLRGYATSFLCFTGPKDVTIRYKDLDPRTVLSGNSSIKLPLKDNRKTPGPPHLMKGIDFLGGSLYDIFHSFKDGFWVLMNAPTWTWIRPVLFNGFQGYRYLTPAEFLRMDITKVGGWLDPMPEAKRKPPC